MEIKLITVGKTDVSWVREGLDLRAIQVETPSNREVVREGLYRRATQVEVSSNREVVREFLSLRAA